MVPEGFKRKLTAILSADVEGYSRLMGEDEESTVRTLTAYREVLTTLIEQHSGTVLDSPGDNLLAEFASVVDSVQCAVAVQREIKARNEELPENRIMRFRIGVNLGDVIQEEDRIYGDGVNIAARLEGLAAPGGICISKTAFDHIESKLPYGYEFLGDQPVKNIARPVGAYRVLMEPRITAVGKKEKLKRWSARWRRVALAGAVVVLIAIIGLVVWNFYFRPSVDPASVEKMAYPLSDKPSIAVLPFVNKSGDSKQDYFSDGITETIITALTQIQNMFVIARNSTFTYKGKNVEIKQVAEELGVRHVLEGSVQKTEDRIRITAQLIDAITGRYLWAERWDRDLSDIFALQDEITKKIVTSLNVKLLKGDDARRWAQSTDNLEAYLKYLEGRKIHLRHTKESNILGRQMLEEAIALDPNYLAAYAQLGIIHIADAAYGWTNRAKSLEAAEELAHKALSLDESFPGGYLVLSGVHLQKGEIGKAVALRRKIVALLPNSANYHAFLGNALLFMEGKAEEAIKEYKIARRLDPFPPNWILNYSGIAYRVNGEYEKAIGMFQKVIKRSPDMWLSHFELAACYGLLGREREARAAAGEVLRIRPNFTIAKLHFQPYRDKADKDRTIEVLRKVGLKLN
jgi:adenylate cyclase